MATLGESATAYEAPQTKNIADLEEVPTNLELEERTFEVDRDGKTETVTIKVVVLNGEDYRVPTSVLKQLKIHLEEKPELKKIRVSRTGEGLKTAYTVIPLE